MYYNDGDIYEGDYKNGVSEGKGIYYYNDGDRYEGDFKNDKQEGKGIYYYPNGDRIMGDYHNDKPIGKHAYLNTNGFVFLNNHWLLYNIIKVVLLVNIIFINFWIEVLLYTR